MAEGLRGCYSEHTPCVFSMGIKATTLQRLKAAPISKVIEATGAKLKSVGREYLTHCLWHEDSNPSLTVNDEKGFCFCHVCRGGGDVLTYLQRRKGLDFPEAARMAGEILGIPVEEDGISDEARKKAKAERRQAIQALERENKQYIVNLHSPRAKRIQGILKARGLDRHTATEFEMGFCPEGYFGGRITLPIYNHKNELVGWTGRATRSREEQPAKYKNSPDRPGIFEKKLLVFNEVRGKEAARLAGSLIFVEGHLDVVSLWKYGVANVVALQGTGAPTPDTLTRLARSCRNFILCFDGDAGGRKAIEQFFSTAGPMAMRGEISVQVAKMPDGRDPDETIRELGENAFHNAIMDADPWLDWVIDEWVGSIDKTNGVLVTEVEDRLRQLIDGLHSNALRAHYIDKAARALASSDKEATEITKTWGARTVQIEQREWRPRTFQQIKIATSRRLLRIYVHRPEHREVLNPMLASIDHPPLAWLVARLKELEQYSSEDLTPHSIMAVVAASEPHFLQQLRTIIQPTVTIDDRPGVLEHCAAILSKEPPQEETHGATKTEEE